MKSYLVVVVASFLSVGALAYPISPNTLVGLSKQADHIVLARVDEIVDKPRVKGEWPITEARLRVVEQWKGELPEKIGVVFSPGMACPAPARYEQGKLVLAFLTEDGNTLYTTSLSYGTLYPHPDELAVFRRSVDAVLALAEDDTERHRELLLRLAEDPATRWHGLYELAASSHSMSRYDRESERQERSALTPEERTRLAKAFFKAPTADATLPMMLRVLGEEEQERVNATAALSLSRALDDGLASYALEEAADALAERVGLAARKDPLDGVEWDDELMRRYWSPEGTDKRVRARVDAILARVDRGLAADVGPQRRERVDGVGANTPP